MNDSFFTIADKSEGLYKEKGSKFMAFAYPVENAEEIRTILDSMKRCYHDARHICYAWVLQADGSEIRSFDDGEPSGTAGKPILAQIQSHRLTHTLVAVVRYFGGTLLGTAGLAIAYRSATIDALSKAIIVEKAITASYAIRFPYEKMNEIMKIVKENNLKTSQMQVGDLYTCILELKKANEEMIITKFRRIERLNIEKLEKND